MEIINKDAHSPFLQLNGTGAGGVVKIIITNHNHQTHINIVEVSVKKDELF